MRVRVLDCPDSGAKRICSIWNHSQSSSTAVTEVVAIRSGRHPVRTFEGSIERRAGAEATHRRDLDGRVGGRPEQPLGVGELPRPEKLVNRGPEDIGDTPAQVLRRELELPGIFVRAGRCLALVALTEIEVGRAFESLPKRVLPRAASTWGRWDHA